MEISKKPPISNSKIIGLHTASVLAFVILHFFNDIGTYHHHPLKLESTGCVLDLKIDI